MELSDLRIFRSVVNEGGITKAAEKLHRVPSNVTARIQKLEKELGKPLFIREKNRLVLSPSGKLLIEYADKLLLLAKQTVAAFDNDLPQGTLRVGVMEAVAATHLPRVMVAFYEQFPEVTVELSTGPSGDLVALLLSGQLDFGLVADPVTDTRLIREPVFGEKLVMVSGTNIKQIDSPLDLGDTPTLLVFSERCAYRKRILRWFDREGVIPRVIEIRSYHALMACAVSGMGIGVVPESLISVHPSICGLVAHDLPSDIANTTTYAVWRKDEQMASINAFYGVICG